MIGSDYVLEAHNIYHTAEVDSGGCLSGEGNAALVLKGVSLTLHSGEVMAVLGSKGSGKRALLDVIAQRTQDSTQGHIQLNGATLTKSLFQQRCGYVTHSCNFIPGLTVLQTLQYSPTTLSGYLKKSKVRQVLADLALSQVANKRVENLNISEHRRLTIGIQLVRDPVMLLLDEPTHGLDPLSAYLLISILSNTAKKSGCGILLSLEKPRSDVFPFLDRALFLCLGGVVYSGGTRAMLEYFHGIGFPCPQLENPLMYYLCLSTVDRRSRDRFIESSQQIEALVQRFSREIVSPDSPTNPNGIGKIPLSYGKPSACSAFGGLYFKMLASTFSAGHAGMKALFMRILLLPLLMGILWSLYYNTLSSDSHGFYTKNGLILNILGLSYGAGMLSTVVLFPSWRKCYAQDQAEGLYSGATLLLAYNSMSISFSLISAAMATSVLYPLITSYSTTTLADGTLIFLDLFGALWTNFVMAEQLCIVFLLVVKSRTNAMVAVSYILCLSITLASGTVRSFKGLQPWLQENTKGTHTRYSSMLLHSKFFFSTGQGDCGGLNNDLDCPSPTEYVLQRMGRSETRDHFDLIVAFAFVIGMYILNMILYSFPLPKQVQNKFRA